MKEPAREHDKLKDEAAAAAEETSTAIVAYQLEVPGCALFTCTVGYPSGAETEGYVVICNSGVPTHAHSGESEPTTTQASGVCRTEGLETWFWPEATVHEAPSSLVLKLSWIEKDCSRANTVVTSLSNQSFTSLKTPMRPTWTPVDRVPAGALTLVRIDPGPSEIGAASDLPERIGNAAIDLHLPGPTLAPTWYRSSQLESLTYIILASDVKVGLSVTFDAAPAPVGEGWSKSS